MEQVMCGLSTTIPLIVHTVISWLPMWVDNLLVISYRVTNFLRNQEALVQLINNFHPEIHMFYFYNVSFCLKRF